MANNSICELPVDKFRYGIDYFGDWVDLFEAAIKISYKGATKAEIDGACMDWLPLKLDQQALLIYDGTEGATWPLKKENFRLSLIDPREEYRWHSGEATISWDGTESFQSLAARVKRAVNTHHKSNRPNEYFFRFRLALPRDYKRAIDLGCSKPDRTIENAVDVAERLRVANTNAEDAATPTAAISTSLTGAAMNCINPALQRTSISAEKPAGNSTNEYASYDHGRRDNSYGHDRDCQDDPDEYGPDHSTYSHGSRYSRHGEHRYESRSVRDNHRLFREDYDRHDNWRSYREQSRESSSDSGDDDTHNYYRGLKSPDYRRHHKN